MELQVLLSQSSHHQTYVFERDPERREIIGHVDRNWRRRRRRRRLRRRRRRRRRKKQRNKETKKKKNHTKLFAKQFSVDFNVVRFLTNRHSKISRNTTVPADILTNSVTSLTLPVHMIMWQVSVRYVTSHLLWQRVMC